MLTVTYRVQGIPVRIQVPDTVFVPNVLTPMVASQFNIRPGETVCDISTGSGFHAIVMAKLGAKHAFGIDVNPDAVRCAERNARLNGVAGRCTFLRGSMFDPVESRNLKFDFIVSTLPNAPEKGPLMRSRVMKKFPRISRYLGAPGDGSLPNVLFVRDAWRYLTARGRIQLHLVDWSNAGPVLKELRERNYHTLRMLKTYIPWYGRRCNFRNWLELFPRGGKRRFEFLRFPKKSGATTIMYLAAKSRKNLVYHPKPAEAEFEWGPDSSGT